MVESACGITGYEIVGPSNRCTETAWVQNGRPLMTCVSPCFAHLSVLSLSELENCYVDIRFEI